MDSRNRKYIIFISILIHILLLFLLDISIKLDLLGISIPEANPDTSAPIVFDLQNPDLPREVIETPHDAKTVKKQKKANFLSDKNALARNRETDPNLDVGEPFARGDYEARELPKDPGLRGKKQSLSKKEKSENKEKYEKNPDLSDFLIRNIKDKYFDYSEKKKDKNGKETKLGIKENLPTVRYDNQKTRARDMGGLSFNTYKWDYAPYMLMLKKRIQKNIYPPLAFTQLGMIDGETLLRFKIYPNGELQDLEVLGYKGHVSLMQTSRTAIEVSAPFPELPSHFPEPYLEVTGIFQYLIFKK